MTGAAPLATIRGVRPSRPRPPNPRGVRAWIEFYRLSSIILGVRDQRPFVSIDWIDLAAGRRDGYGVTRGGSVFRRRARTASHTFRANMGIGEGEGWGEDMIIL